MNKVAEHARPSTMDAEASGIPFAPNSQLLIAGAIGLAPLAGV